MSNPLNSAVREISSEEYTAMRDAFVKLSNVLHGKHLTNKFLKACTRVFGNSCIIEYRKSHCVVIVRNGELEIYAYSHSSDRFCKLDGTPERTWPNNQAAWTIKARR